MRNVTGKATNRLKRVSDTLNGIFEVQYSTI